MIGKIFQVEDYKLGNVEVRIRQKWSGLADILREVYRLSVPDTYMADRTAKGTKGGKDSPSKPPIEPSLFKAIYGNVSHNGTFKLRKILTKHTTFDAQFISGSNIFLIFHGRSTEYTECVIARCHSAARELGKEKPEKGNNESEEELSVDEIDKLIETSCVDSKYFGNTYLRGKPARGRRKAVPPRYIPQMWNQYDATLQGLHRTKFPERELLKKMIRRQRGKDLSTQSPNPVSLLQLEEVSERFQKSTKGDLFVLYDSRNDPNSENEGRILLYAIGRDLLLVSHSWYLDGTFKVSPSIFCQLFIIFGTVSIPGSSICFCARSIGGPSSSLQRPY